MYLENLRGMGEHKILSKGGSDPVARLVKEVSKYKDLPEDDNKVFLKLEALANLISVGVRNQDQQTK